MPAILNKLSIDFLHAAVTREQSLNANPFVLLGHAETLKMVRRFLEAIKRDSWGTLWGIPMVESYHSDENSLLLGATTKAFPEPDDFSTVLKHILEDTSDPTTPVWGRLLRLA